MVGRRTTIGQKKHRKKLVEDEMARENKKRFGLGWGKTGKWRFDFSFCFLFFIASFLAIFPSIIFAQSDAPISFTKEEIAFFKWGTSETEVKLSTGGISQRAKKNSKPEKTVLNQYRWANTFRMDGNDNLYFNGGNGFIFVVSPDGNSIKTISIEKTGGFSTVDEMGNVYSFFHKKGEPLGFILTRPDGTQENYADFDLGHVENGIAYEKKEKGDRAVTIFNNNNTPEKKPPLLFPKLTSNQTEADFEKDFVTGTFTFDTAKINKHLEKINKRIDNEKVQIKLGFNNDQNFMGVDDDENFYFKICTHESTAIYTPCKAAYVAIYSSRSLKLAEVPIEKNYFDGQCGPTDIDIHGNIFEMVAFQDGIHIYKWAKN